MVNRYVRKLRAFTSFGDALASLSTCKRARCAAVVFPLDFTAVYAIGYNGPARGLSNDSCKGEEGRCGCAHAEANAMVKLDPSRAKPSVLYTTTAPCPYCAALVANAGCVSVVVYGEAYRDGAGVELLERSGIPCIRRDEISDKLPKWWPTGAVNG